MLFKFFQFFSITTLTITALSACGPHVDYEGRYKNDNLIGTNLETSTGLRFSDGTNLRKVSIYDETIHKIHQIDLNQMTLERTLNVTSPNEKHFVLQSNNSNYIVDLTEKHITIFDKNSNAQKDPIQFLGIPRSASFRPDLGWLVIYDSLQSVGVIKLDSSGQVLDSRTFGSVVDGTHSIVSGDINDNGDLILALSDNSIATVDLSVSLTTKNWSATSQTTTLGKISWLSPIPGAPQRLLLNTDTAVVLYDLATSSVVSTMTVNYYDVIKMSKSINPHLVIKSGVTSMALIYTDGTTLSTRSFEILDAKNQYSIGKTILSSELDLALDRWTYVYADRSYGYSLYNDVNQKKEDRHLVRYRISDKLALKNVQVSDSAIIKLSEDFFLSIFPSKLGYIEKQNILDDSKSVIRNFNLKKY